MRNRLGSAGSELPDHRINWWVFNSDGNKYCDTDKHSVNHGDEYIDADEHPDKYAVGYQYGYKYSDQDVDEHPHPDKHLDEYANKHPDEYGNAGIYADKHGNAGGDFDEYSDEYCDRNPGDNARMCDRVYSKWSVIDGCDRNDAGQHIKYDRLRSYFG